MCNFHFFEYVFSGIWVHSYTLSLQKNNMAYSCIISGEFKRLTINCYYHNMGQRETN